MHVKLEVETAPLSVFVTKLKRVAKITLFLIAASFVNLIGVIFAFTWIPNHVQNMYNGIILAWAIAISITVCIWVNILTGWWEGRQEAKWRSSLD